MADSSISYKICTRCDLLKAASDFSVNRENKQSGLQSWCKECKRQNHQSRKPPINPRLHDYSAKPGEKWEAAPGFDDAYSVSNLGRVRRNKPARGAKAGYILRPTTTRRGYKSVILRKDNHNFRYLVHRLVATAFLPASNVRLEVNHLNGNPSDNSAVNLEWATRQENASHATAVLKRCGKKLSESNVLFIRQSHTSGATQGFLARHFGISKSTVSAIIARRIWKHI